MRSISTEQSNILAALGRASHMRIQVKDSGGTFRDLTTYPGTNLVDRATWRETVDDSYTAEIELKRELEFLSLAPFMQNSPLNRGFDPGATFAQLLALNREIKIEWGLAPEGMTPDAWSLGFHGYIDVVDWGGPTIRLECRDQSAKLANTFIERERAYAFAQGAGATKGCYLFEEGQTYAVNDLVVPSDLKRGVGKYYKVTSITTGISGTEPAWPTSGAVTSGGVTFTKEGDTSTSAGTAVETIMQQLIDDHLGAGVVTLTTPTSPGWNIRAYKQKSESVWNAIRFLAEQIGWDLRFTYDSGTTSFKLKFTQPDRAKSVPDRTFAKSDYLEIDQLTQDLSLIRNRVRVRFLDSQDKWPNGDAKRKEVIVQDSASITKWNGTFFMGVSEATTSNIDTTAEATTFANAILSDLKDPNAEQSVSMLFFPFAELGDLYSFDPNDRHYSTSFDAAVVSVEHSLSLESHRTTLLMRGKPSGGWKRHGSKEAKIGLDSHSVLLGSVFGSATMSATRVIGGHKLQLTADDDKSGIIAQYEFHISTSSSFTPSAATLAQVGKSKEVILANLTPGTTYYAKAVPLGWNAGKPVRGLPSNETSFVAAYAEPIHLNPDTIAGPLPPNGSFEGWWSGSTSPPDHWSMVTGTWDTDARMEEGDRKDGVKCVELKNTAVAAKIRSIYFPVRASSLYSVEAWIKKVSTPTDGAVVAIEWYDSAKSSISTSSFETALNTIGTGWTLFTRTYTAPSTAVYARVFVAKGAAVAYAFKVDAVRVVGGDEPWHNVGDTDQAAFSNSWVNFGSSFEAAAYYKDSRGIVHLKGFVKSGSANAIFTLPVGYRPAEVLYFATVTADDAFGVCHIATDGTVNRQAGSTTYFNIRCSFRASN